MAEAIGLALRGLAEEEDQGMIDYANWLGHRGRIASRKVGKPGWLAFSIECIGSGGDVLVKGGVPVGFTKAGKPKWRKPYDIACVTESELDTEKRRFEAEAGKCADCEGSGKSWIGWSKGDGHRYAPCAKCKGTATGVGAPASPVERESVAWEVPGDAGERERGREEEKGP